jgi:GNAT superfamily N-acetyltransferase
METVKFIPREDYAALSAIAAEYLGQDPGVLKEMYDATPSAFTGYYIDDTLVGCCYGKGNDSGSFSLEGIAVVHPYHAHGRGGKLLAFFEKSVVALGYFHIGLGSAGGYVERFYMKNGYRPTALKILVEGDCWRQKQAGYAYPVTAVETQGLYTKLVLSASDYANMDKDDIARHYGGVDSFFVFEKSLEALR